MSEMAKTRSNLSVSPQKKSPAAPGPPGEHLQIGVFGTIKMVAANATIGSLRPIRTPPNFIKRQVPSLQKLPFSPKYFDPGLNFEFIVTPLK
jgi:hypothetical protein